MGGRPCQVQFSNISGTLFTIDRSQKQRPVRSVDNGVTWSPLAEDPTNGTAKSLHASPFHAGRLILSDFSRVFFSDDGGGSWELIFRVSLPSNVFVAGVHFTPALVKRADNLAFVGTNHGLLVVSQSKRTATNLGLRGIAQDSAMFAFAGSTNASSGCTRLCCIVAPRNSSQFAQYQFDEEGFDLPTGVFQLNFGDSAAGVSWVAMHDSLPRLSGNGGSAGLTNVAVGICTCVCLPLKVLVDIFIHSFIQTYNRCQRPTPAQCIWLEREFLRGISHGQQRRATWYYDLTSFQRLGGQTPMLGIAARSLGGSGAPSSTAP